MVSKRSRQTKPFNNGRVLQRKGPFKVVRELRKAAHCHRRGQLQSAEKICKKILKTDPCHPVAWNLLGVIAHQTSKFNKASDYFKKAMQYEPGNPTHYNNLGFALISKGQFEQGIASCQQALRLKPDLAQAHNNMGLGMLGLGRLPEAITCFQTTVSIMPSHAKAYNNMALAFLRSGRSHEALKWSKEALSVQPDYAEAYNSLGLAYHAEGDLDKALDAFKNAVQLDKDYLEGYKSLGMAYQDQGKLDDAASCFHKVLKVDSDPGMQVRLATLLPVIYDSHQDMKESRQALTDRLEFLKEEQITLKDPYRQVGVTTFLLAYQGLNDREIQKRIASFYEKACPSLQATSSAKEAARSGRKKINIGFISKHFFNHTIGALNLGIVKHLSKNRFNVELFRFPGREDRVARAFNSAADKVVLLPKDLQKAREKIAGRSLDILFYLDIGMDCLTYFLAFSRLAPVQCVTWGHPVTTGIANMDYFISLKNAEPEMAADHYSERLIQLETLGTYFSRPQLPENISSRSSFGLPEDGHLYVCPQSLFKFHPDMDEAFGSILRRDPKGLLVLIHGKNSSWSRLLQARLKRTIPDVICRVKFLPRMCQNDFLSLLYRADVVLDTMHFGGGKTSLESFACGTPVVTLPGAFLRGRLTLGFYKHMDIMDCVAKDNESYVNIALRLANDKLMRDELRSRINSRSGVLYENMDVVWELERFFHQAVAENNDL